MLNGQFIINKPQNIISVEAIKDLNSFIQAFVTILFGTWQLYPTFIILLLKDKTYLQWLENLLSILRKLFVLV